MTGNSIQSLLTDCCTVVQHIELPEQQTYRVHKECYRAEGLPLVALQKMVLAPYPLQLYKLELKMFTAWLPLNSTSIWRCISSTDISFQAWLSDAWSLIRISFAQRPLLFMSTFWKWGEMVWDCKGSSLLLVWTTFIWATIR